MFIVKNIFILQCLSFNVRSSYLLFQVELNQFVADHDFCLEIKYEEQHQPRVVIEKADTTKGSFVYLREHERQMDSLLLTDNTVRLQCNYDIMKLNLNDELL